MGSSKQTQQQSSETSPWAPAQPMLQSILSQLGGLPTSPSSAQTGAASTLMSEAGGVPSFGAPGAGTVNSLFGYNTNPQQGILTNAYGTFQNELNPYASGANNNPYNNPALQSLIQTTGQDITNQVNGQFAAAGRDLSPANTTALARGLSQGEAGILTNQYNQNVGNQFNAADSLFGAGGGTASGLTAQQLQQLGINTSGLSAAGSIPGLMMAPGTAQFGAATNAWGLPIQDLQTLEGATIPIGALGGQSSGTGTTTQAANPWQEVLGGSMLAASMFSDERLKDDISPPIGMLNGVPVHQFTWKADPTDTPQVGVIAQEAEKTRPDVVARDPKTGFKKVDYAALQQPPQQSGAESDSGFWPTRPTEQLNYAQGPTIGQVDEPPYYAEGEQGINEALARKQYGPMVSRMQGAQGRSPEDLETARDRVATAAMFASPEAGLLQGLNEGAHTGDYSGAVAPAVGMVGGPIAGRVISSIGPRGAKATLGALGILNSTGTESAAADQPEQAAAANKEAAANPPKLALSQGDADKAQKQELATLMDQRRAIVDSFNQQRSDLLKTQPQMSAYGLSNPSQMETRTQRLAAKGQDVTKMAAYTADMGAYNGKADKLNADQNTALAALDTQIQGLPQKYADAVETFSHLPFTERNPTAGFLVGPGIVAGENILAGALTRGSNAWKNRGNMARWNDALDSANDALSQTTKSGNLSASKTRLAKAQPFMGTLQQFAENPPGGITPRQRNLATAGALGTIPFAMAFPQEYDFLTQKPGTPAHDQAVANFESPPFWATRLGFGAAVAAPTAGIGWKAPLPGEAKPPLAASQGAIDAYNQLAKDVKKAARKR